MIADCGLRIARRMRRAKRHRTEFGNQATCPVRGLGFRSRFLLDIVWAVKACSYCGRKNDDEARYCFECGTEFSAPPAAKHEAEWLNHVLHEDLI
jgi:hypothetical protein